MSEAAKWWQRGVIYQIYPRSFQDSNGDGVGDLQGILSRLDYVAGLGVDAIWVSPIFVSPMADHGYDVANYTDIDPLFGTMADFERLVQGAHERGLKVILDWVPNHSSDEHPWFMESRSAKDNPKRDWYLWRPPGKDGGEPNNWTSFFGGPAWTFDEGTGEYYLHLFHKKQPDLNWRNPEVKEVMLNTLRFWLEKGVDGFRMDVIGLIMKDDQFRDNPLVEVHGSGYDTVMGNQEMIYNAFLPEVHPVLKEIRAVLDEYGDTYSVGEVWVRPIERWVRYYGLNNDELHMPFNFDLMSNPWSAKAFQESVEKLEAALQPGNWPNYVLGNHDFPRLGTRYGAAKQRAAAMLLLTLRGTPTLYMGDEIGMVDGDVPKEKMQDPQGLYFGYERSRDGCRTPFQWLPDADNAGFSSAEPWLPVADNVETVNQAAAEDDPCSILHLYRSLLRLRRDTPALHRGDYATVAQDNPQVYAYTRTWEAERRLMVINFSSEEQAVALGQVGARGEILLSTEMDREGTAVLGSVMLRPDEGLILALDLL